MKCEIDDWVAWMRDNRIVYGHVVYRAERSVALWQESNEHHLLTDSGSVNESEVLERRAKSEGS